MTTGAAPLFFERIAANQLLGPVKMPNRVERTALPVIQKLGALPGETHCLPSAQKESLFADSSYAFRAVKEGLDTAFNRHLPGLHGEEFVGMTSVAYSVIGAAGCYQGLKVARRAEQIGDLQGKHLARIESAENAFMSAGSTVTIPLKGISMVQDITKNLQTPLSLMRAGNALGIAQTVLNSLSTFFYSVYYLLNGARYGWGIVQWIQGRSWREELLKSDDPIKLIKKQLQNQVSNLKLKHEDYKKLALDAGEKWMKAVIKESKKQGIEITVKNRREAFAKFVERHPELVDKMVGPCPFELTGEGNLIRLGKFLAIRNECARFEAECKRKLGEKSIEALKAQDVTGLKEALNSSGWTKNAFKVSQCVLGLLATLGAFFLSGGIGVGIVLVLAGIGALLSIYLEDLGDLKAALENNTFKKRDRFFIYFSLALSVVAVVGLVALCVLSGGVLPFVVSLVLTTAWMLTNLRAAVTLWRHDYRPWEVQKTPILRTYRQLLETTPSKEKARAVFQKISRQDQALIEKMNGDVRKCEELIQKAHRKATTRLAEELRLVAS